MKRFFCGLCILTMIGANVSAAVKPQLISLRNGSNIYAKTLLFYLPLADSSSLEHSWMLHGVGKTFDSTVTIDKGRIFDKPVISELFRSDFFLRIQRVPYKPESSSVVLPVTIRVNRNIIERNVKFRIHCSKGKMRLTGVVKGVRISDIRQDGYYPKRLCWKIPLLIDLHYETDQIN